MTSTPSCLWEGPPFAHRLEQSNLTPFRARSIEILQVNVGRRCNLACKHCHLAAGPDRTESMSWKVLERCLEIARYPSITTIDITGGAPELHPDIDKFIALASRLGKRLIVRSNLVILDESPYARFIELYKKHGVELVGSLPDLHSDKNDRQRGKGAFSRAVAVLRKLNRCGYGVENSGLPLDLVHNPVGAFLPGAQQSMETEYRRKLLNEYDIQFSQLFCLANNPTGRYLDYLIHSDNYTDYMDELSNSFNAGAAKNAMCRLLLSVGWDGTLYDCDFNQALGCPVNHGAPAHIDGFNAAILENREIIVGNHCYACTAGAGSSCQGATSE